MSAPSNYATDFIHSVISGVVLDIQDIIDQIVDDLTNNLPVDSRWTALGGDEYQSPIQDPGGASRSMTLGIVAVSTTRMEWVVKDQTGAVLWDGTFDMVAGPVDAHIFVGPTHAVCEIESVGTGFEHGVAVMTDPGSFGLGSTSTYVAARSSRDSAGSQFIIGNNQLGMLDAGGVTTPQARCSGFSGDGVSTTVYGTTTAGSTIALVMEVAQFDGGTLYRFSGRAYQIVALPRDFVGPEIDVPLDDVTLATFRALTLSGAPSAQNLVVGVRVG